MQIFFPFIPENSSIFSTSEAGLSVSAAGVVKILFVFNPFKNDRKE